MTDTVIPFDPDGDGSRVVSSVCDALEQGQIVGLPTETAYVPVALPKFASRLSRISAARGSDDQLVVLLEEPLAFLEALAVPAQIRRLVRRGWPGPIVIEIPITADQHEAARSLGIADAVDAGALRVTMTVSRIIDEVVAKLGRPIASLMRFSSPMASSAGELREQGGDQIRLIVDAGPPRFSAPPTMVRASREGVSIATSGLVGEEMVHRMSAKVLLFVCTGNTCRSPMAEGLMRQMMAEKLRTSPEELIKSGVLVLSAGLAAGQGMPASEESVSLLKQRGIDIGGHSSQPVTHELLQHSDHVFTMTSRHREQILRTYPELADQVEVLTPSGEDVVDPIGGTWEDYAECLRQIEVSLRERIDAGLGSED